MSHSAYPVVRIIAAVVDTHRLTLYKEDGSTIFVQQGDPNLRRIVEQATPQLLQQGWADVQLEPPPENSYAHFEKESSGLVRFFKIAKSKLKELMTEPVPVVPPDTRPVVPMSIGQVPTPVMATEFPSPALGEAPLPKGSTFNAEAVAAALEAVPKPDLVIIKPKTMEDVPASLISAAADAIEEFDEDELERYAEEQRAKEAKQDMSGVYASTTEVVVVPLDEAVVTESLEELVQLEQTADDKRAADAVAEILSHAMPVTDPGFHEKMIGKQGAIAGESGYTSDHLEEPDAPDTIIAVVGDKIIPGMEKIKSQFARAAKMGSTVGVEKFLQRIGAVIKDRAHSIDELLTFMERGDLPIADDGSILIYKVLNHHSTEEGRKVYVDCHSGNVKQWEGAYVCMDPKMVDMNRRQECSVGLHVARRGYVRGFSGSVCVLGKLAPEDVIAVPHGEANKLRACGYHIIKELTPAQHQLLCNNLPISDDPAGKVLLADAIAGRHIRITHRVEIRGPKGADVITTEVAEADAPVHQVPEAKPMEKVEALPNDQKVDLADPVDPVGVAKVVTEAVEKQLSRKEQAKILYDALAGGGQEALDAIHAFKKASKVSWEKLGLPEINGPVISLREPKAKPKQLLKGKNYAKKKAKIEKAQKAVAKKAAKVESPSKPVKEKKVEIQTADSPASITQEVKPEKQPLTRTVNDVELDNPGGGSYRERIHKILAGGGITSIGQAQAVYKLKQQSRKSWDVLGVSSSVVVQINHLINQK